jgi:hypothetical protein
MMAFDTVTIAKTNCYEISVSKSENKADLIFKGFWNENDEMQYYFEDIKAAADKLKPGFIFILDMSDFSGCISKYLNITIEAQKYMITKGLKVTAEILPPNPMLKPICEMLSEKSGMNTLYFNDKDYAERWFQLNSNTN